MKRISLITFLSFFFMPAFSQTSTFIGVYGGGGLTTTYNYDIALSGGVDFIKGLSHNGRIGLGFNAFYQTISMAYDNEAYREKNGIGNAGVMLLNQSSFIVFAPKFDYGIGKKQNIHFYVNAGIAYNMSGTETMRKWDKSNGAGLGNYDSVINTTPNINKMGLHVGIGFTEYLYTSKHWRFTVTEDFGFINKSLSTTSDFDNPSRTPFSPHDLKPGCFSLQIGLMHIHYPD
jgi:hypothetical protein